MQQLVAKFTGSIISRDSMPEGVEIRLEDMAYVLEHSWITDDMDRGSSAPGWTYDLLLGNCQHFANFTLECLQRLKWGDSTRLDREFDLSTVIRFRSENYHRLMCWKDSQDQTSDPDCRLDGDAWYVRGSLRILEWLLMPCRLY